MDFEMIKDYDSSVIGESDSELGVEVCKEWRRIGIFLALVDNWNKEG